MKTETDAREAEERPCGVTDPHFTQCGLKQGHEKKHEFTIAPPDEYYEEDEECITDQQQ